MAGESESARARELSAEGQRLLGTGDHERASEVFREAARAFGAAGDGRSQVSHEKMAADICLVMKRPREALESYEDVLRLLDGVEYPEMRARVLANMGLIQAQSGEGAEAVGRFRESLALFERLGSTLHVAQQWGNIGSTYRDMQEHDQALAAYRQSLRLYEGLGEAGGIADQYTNLAYIHSLRQELRKALDLYEKAVSLYTKAGDSRRADLTAQNVRSLRAALEKGAD